MNKSKLQHVRVRNSIPKVPKAHSNQNQYLRPTAAALAVATCFSGNFALANPTAPTVVNGTASFATAGNILNVTNSHNAVINWGSFSIGVNELTKFIQPSALSAVLNRVTGQDPSAILGALQSNGRVFLVNPNGIVFGAGAQIDVAGLVASTLNLSNEDFLNNRMRFTDGAGAGSVINQGNISSGSVYLVGQAVTNDGLITSPNGEVVLAAGNSVELVNPGTPNLRVEIVAPDNEARNLGTITTEAGRIGIYAGLVNNSGTLNASSAVAEGGRIMLKATQNTTLASTSILDASGAGGGRIDVLADDTVHVDGRLDASAPTSGNGGFIETSGKNRVKIASSSAITTNAPSGKTGTWLIDPTNFVISSYGGDAYGSTIGSNLASSNVIITSDQGSGGVDGDILVNDTIAWTAPNSLMLLARRNIEINSRIDGGGDLVFLAGWNGASTTTPAVTNGVGDIISLSYIYDGIRTNGNVYFEAGRDILLGAVTVGAGSRVASGVAFDGLAKSVKFVAGRNVALTDPDGGAQIYATGNYGSAANIRIEAKTGSVTFEGSIVEARGGDEGGEGGGPGGAATVTVTAPGSINVVNSSVAAIGGDSNSGGTGGAATVNMVAGGGTSLSSSSVTADGGAANYGGNGGAAAVSLNVTGGNLQIDGGEGAAIGGSGTTTGNATVSLASAGNIELTNGTTLRADATMGNSSGAALVLLAAAGNTNLSNFARINSSGGIGIGSANITLDNARLNSTGGTIVTATGNFSALNNSDLYSSGILNIGTGGNVLVDNSSLSGNPDVILTVRGVINQNNGGTINAAVPTTIYATFPTLASGGYFVNGIEGVVFDPVTGTGFRAGGVPAILGTNFMVTYGGGLTAPTDALIVAMGESTKPPDPDKDKDLFKDVEDDKKDAPVCR